MTTSTQEVVSDGTLVLLDLSINYLDRSEISVFYDNVPAGALTWSWVGVSEKRIAFSPAVANGVTVLVKRTTDITKLRHEFSFGAAFTAGTLDEDLTQVLHVAQEAAETVLSGSFFDDVALNGNKIIGLAPGTNPNDGVNVAQLTDTYNAIVTAVATNAANAAISATEAADSAAEAEAILAALTAPMGSNLVGYTPTGAGATTRTAQSKFRDTFSVMDFGAVGNGVADDTAAVQAAITYLKTYVESYPNTMGIATLDLAGRVYKVTSSINATGITNWGWAIENGAILGACTGKAVLDFTGSRGGKLSHLVIYGDKTNMPRVGIQCARAAAPASDAFCDHYEITNVTVLGYYSLASVYFYGQETSHYNHCRFWNSNNTGYAGIHLGVDLESYLSDYLTPITGDTSYINDLYSGCDWRYLPIGNLFNITNVTSASQAVVTTASAHSFTTGDSVVVSAISGMGVLDNIKTTATVIDATRVRLDGVDTTALTYISGGTITKAQTKPTVLFGRGNQHVFNACYVVNYGSDSIRWDFSTYQSADNIKMDMLFEGDGSRSHLRVTSNNVAPPSIRGFELSAYTTHARDNVISTDAVGVKNRFYDAKLKIASFAGNITNKPTLFDDASKYSLHGVDILYPLRAKFNPVAANIYRGTYVAVDDGLVSRWNETRAYKIDGTFTPIITSSVGTLTTTAVNSAIIRRISDTLFFILVDVTIVANGTGAGFINIGGIPLNMDVNCTLAGRQEVTAGSALVGTSGSTSIIIRKYDNTYPVSGDGTRLRISGICSTNTPV